MVIIGIFGILLLIIFMYHQMVVIIRLYAMIYYQGHLCGCLGFNALYCSNDYVKSVDKMKGICIYRMVTFGVEKNNRNQSVMNFFWCDC